MKKIFVRNKKNDVFEFIVDENLLGSFMMKHKRGLLKVSTEFKDIVDVFLIEDELGNKNMWRKVYMETPNNLKVYAMVWARNKEGNPILKPVAKMNDKGKFELL